MRFKSELFFVTVIIFVLISLSCVSAQNLNETIQDESDYNIIGENEDMGESSFDDFIYDVTSGSDEVNLDQDYVDDSDWSDYKRRGVDTFDIDKSVKVNGNGHSLDWNHGPVQLSIYADDVTLKNIVFKNFNNVSEYTTAISWDGNNGLIENCTFIGNAFEIGYFNIYGNNVVVNNCKFINNEGNTVFWVTNEYNAKLTNCEFTNNIVHECGNGFICWHSEKGIIDKNIFKDNRYSSDSSFPGELCFNLIGCDSNNVVKNNIFLNHGFIINNGIQFYNKEFVYGENYKILVISDDGKPVGANESVYVNFNVDFYGGEHYSEEGIVDDLITTVTLNYTLKTDANGYINFKINDVINDENIKNNGMSFKYDNNYGVTSFGSFFLNNRAEDKQFDEKSIIFEYKNNKLLLDSIFMRSSISIMQVDSYRYPYYIKDLKITDYNKNANYNLVFSFIDSNGNELKNRDVSIKIGDKTYHSKTDKYGWASVNFNAKYKSYTYSVTNPLTKQVLQGSFKVSKRFNGNSDVSKYYKSSTNYKVRILDNDGKAIKKDYVTFTIGKITKKIKTDSKGYAVLKLNQKPGKYTVVAQYWGHKVSNKIIIKSPIITKNVKKKFKKSGKFKVKILNSKGKPYAKQNVKIVLKGKTYKIKTNKKGVATFKIPKKLKVGKYTIKSKYNGLTVKNKITVKK